MNRFRLVMLKKRKKKKYITKRVQNDHFLPFHWYQFVLFLTAHLMVHTILHFTSGLNAEQIVILESSSGGTAVAVNKTDDTVFVKVSPPRGWNLKGGEGWGKFKLFTKENKSKYGLRKTTKTNLKIRFRSSSTKKTHPNRQKKPKAFMKLFPPSFPPPPPPLPIIFLIVHPLMRIVQVPWISRHQIRLV